MNDERVDNDAQRRSCPDVSRLADALHYAALGYSVFPLQANGKQPATRHGLRDATRDDGQIRRWWGAGSNLNIGLLPPKDVLVLDMDDAVLVPGLLDRFELHEAPMHRTPRGGAHVFLRAPTGFSMPTRVRAAPGVDVRGLNHAYVVAPHSGVNGATYEVVRPLAAPTDLPLATPALLEFLRPPIGMHTPIPAVLPPKGDRHANRYARAALEREAAALAAMAPDSGRNNQLNAAAFKLGRFVATGHLETWEVVQVLAKAAAAAGLGQNEVTATLASGLEAGMRTARGTAADWQRHGH